MTILSTFFLRLIVNNKFIESYIFFTSLHSIDGRLVVVIETSPDSREIVSPQKTFIQVY